MSIGYHDHDDAVEFRSFVRMVLIPAALAIALGWLIGAANAQTTRINIEPNADIIAARGVTETRLRRVLPEAVDVVRQQGFQCDSVSGFRPGLAFDGFVLRCNRFTRQYELRLVDGYWLVIRRR